MTPPERRLLEALFASDHARAAATFAADPSLDVPLEPPVRSVAELTDLARRWPHIFGVAPGTAFVERRRTVDGARAILEVLVPVSGASGSVELPIAIIVDLASDGRIDAARMYWAEYWTSGKQGLRPCLRPNGPSDRPGRPEDLRDVNAQYFANASAGEVDAVLALFDDPVYIELGPRRIQGQERIRPLYEAFLREAGLQLRFDSVTDDGQVMVLEWTTYGREPSFSGLAAYTRAPTGRIESIHMYDNFDPASVPGVLDEAGD